MENIQSFIKKVSEGEMLSRAEAADAFDLLMSGEANEAQIAGFLMALKMRGETVDEITGAAEVMRAKATGVPAPEGAVDTCGTGGDSSGTFNISTASAFVVAGAGLPVAKHGNKSISSKSGSADVLAALGVNLDVPPAIVTRSIEEAGIGFMFAPAHHSAMKYVGPARVALGVRTIFNLLGPLANPAGAKRQVLGVFSKKWLRPMAAVLKNLGSERLWVVHGEDGLDELTTTGKSYVVSLENDKLEEFTVHPTDVGLSVATPDMLKGGEAGENAVAIQKLLDGAPGAFRDIVLMNAGAALLVGERARTHLEGVELAAKAIDEGRARDALERLIAITNQT